MSWWTDFVCRDDRISWCSLNACLIVQHERKSNCGLQKWFSNIKNIISLLVNYLSKLCIITTDSSLCSLKMIQTALSQLLLIGGRWYYNVLKNNRNRAAGAHCSKQGLLWWLRGCTSIVPWLLQLWTLLDAHEKKGGMEIKQQRSCIQVWAEHARPAPQPASERDHWLFQ